MKLIGPGAPPSGGGGGGGGGAGYTLTITPPTATIALNSTLQLTLTLRDAQGAQVAVGNVAWTTSNQGVLAVDQSGQVRAVGLGSATATASTAGTAANVIITVVTTPVASVVVSPNSATLQLGSTSTFTAVARDAANNALPGRAVLWSTSNAAVLTVGQTSGVAQAVGVGAATLTATSEGQSGTAAVTVQNVPVAAVQITPTLDTVQIGQQTQLAATPRDAAGNALGGRQVQWSSSAPTLARVSGNGLIDGLAVGTVTISATSEGRTGTATIVVIPVPVAVVIVVPQTVTVQVGATTTFNGTPRDANGNALTGRPISWRSADTLIARVSPTGIVSGIAPGSVLISATVEGVVGSAFVTVTAVPATLVAVTIVPQTAALQSGQTQQFSLTGTLSDNSTIPVSGSFQAPGGSINGAGIYTAPDASGTFLVIGTATGTTLRDTATVTVTRPPVATVQVTPASATVDVNQTLGLTATMRDASGNVLTNRTVTWTSTNTTVATVNAGVVTARAVGSATITATSEGQSGSAAITTRLTPVASVSVNPTSATVGVGLSTSLLATCRDAGGNVLTGRTQTWATSNPAVATVNAGTVTVLSVGTANITVNCEGPTATAVITGVVVQASAQYPNEPVGATVLMDYDTDFGNPGDPPWGHMSGTGSLSTITDVTAPVNPSKVGRVRFSAGCCDGSGPAQLTTYSGLGRGAPPSGWTKWYVSDWIKFDPNFTPHSCCQKIFEFYWNSGGDKWLLVKADPSGGFPLHPRLTSEFAGQPSNNWGGRPLMQAGRWYQYEIVIHRTGRVQLWIREQGGQPESLYDGTLPGFGTPSGEFLFWWWGYGGLGAYPGPTAYIYHNHFRVSYTR